MQGRTREKLAELAGRECYDSLGRGRSSFDYHQHILEVGHFSVYEHCQFTLLAKNAALRADALLELLNRPGLFVKPTTQGHLRVTMNLRTVLDWEKFGDKNAAPLSLLLIARELFPQVFAKRVQMGRPNCSLDAFVSETLDPVYDEEKWVTLRMTGSRGFSHELVRHGDFTAISQRSTRYVDESEGEWCLHPLVNKLCGADENFPFADKVRTFIEASRGLYRDTVALGSTELGALGIDKTTSRKQARGAARGFLGNALGTSVIFSASVAQWRWILGLRAHPAADAEIRESAAAALKVLKTSRYGDRFADMILAPSPDGFGEVLD